MTPNATNTAEEAVHKVESYLFRLGVAMGNFPAAERDETLREIRAHILDSVEASGRESVETVLGRLGSPEKLAESFEREKSLARASRSLSPWLWLRVTAAWALTGLQGFIAFLVAIVGYCLGGCILLAGLLKPILPNHVGLFVSSHTITLNRQGMAGERELLGSAFILFALTVGGLLVAGTSLLLQWLTARFRQAKQYLRGSSVYTPSAN